MTFNDFSQRFWSKVDIRGTDDCWKWKAAKTNGYGVLSKHKNEADRRITAHAIGWELTFGKISKELSVGHKCSNKDCVNPKHLYITTHKENMREFVQRCDYLYPDIDDIILAQRKAIVSAAKYMLSVSESINMEDMKYIKIFEIMQDIDGDYTKIDIEPKAQFQEVCGHPTKYISSSNDGTHFCLMCEYQYNANIVKNISSIFEKEGIKKKA